MAAPVAAGMPWPIEPPVSVSRVCRGAAARAMGSANPEVLASSEMMACSGSDAAIVLARLIALSGPGSAGGGGAASVRTGLAPAATWSASVSRAASVSWSGSARTVTEQPGGTRSLARSG